VATALNHHHLGSHPNPQDFFAMTGLSLQNYAPPQFQILSHRRHYGVTPRISFVTGALSNNNGTRPSYPIEFTPFELINSYFLALPQSLYLQKA